jgi:hypothetical protein
MITDHEFKPYVSAIDICVAELGATGDTCNRMGCEHVDAAPTAMLLAKYADPDEDDEDAILEELHKRAMNGDVAAREVLNDYDRDEPGWTPQTGSEARP